MCSDPQVPSVQLACDMTNASWGLCVAGSPGQISKKEANHAG